jgi:hypothetical protein
MEFNYETESGETKTANKFLPMAEAKMHDTLMRSMEAQMVYGKKQTRAAADGYWIKTGAGIREILKDSWQEYYNGALTTNRLKNFLLKIFFTRKDEGDRAVTFMTGTYGSIAFHNMLSAEARSFLTVDTMFVNKVSGGASTGTPHLAYGAQFTRYNGPEGIVVDVTKNAFYDDRTYCKRSHPFYPNVPIDSFRMTVLDFGESQGQKNIQMISVKDTYINGYVAGTYTPSGPVTSGAMGSAKAGYSLHTAGTMGVILRDPSRCGELILSVD